MKTLKKISYLIRILGSRLGQELFSTSLYMRGCITQMFVRFYEPPLYLCDWGINQNVTITECT